MFFYITKRKSHFVRGNRKNNTVSAFLITDNDFDGGPPLELLPLTFLTPRTLVYAIHPDEILYRKKLLESKKNLNQNERQFLTFAKTVDISDNQILMFVTLNSAL